MFSGVEIADSDPVEGSSKVPDSGDASSAPQFQQGREVETGRTSPFPPLRTTESARLALNRLVDDPSLSLLHVFQRICEIAADTLEVERVSVWLVSEDRQQLRCVTLFERSRREHSGGQCLNVADFPIYLTAIRERRVLPCELVQSDPRAIELRDMYLVPLGITSMLDAPIHLGEEVIGVVCHEHVGPPREWSTEDRDFAISVADAVGFRLKLAQGQLSQSVARNRAEALPEGDRYSVVGRLAAGVAHDFRNLLTVILGNAALIARRNDVPPEVIQRAEQILEVGERGAQLIRHLLEFGREPTGRPRLVSLSEALQHFLPLLQTGVGKLYPIEFQAASGQDWVWIDPGHLERVVMNLVLNAREAMPKGGTIAIRVSIEYISGGLGLGPAGYYVCLEVRDSGVGIAAEDLPRIFELGFTTKTNGIDRGLGLAIVWRLVERAGGFIRVESQPGAGSVFRIYWPRVTGHVPGKSGSS
jgi:signal transduction histidine kinase